MRRMIAFAWMIALLLNVCALAESTASVEGVRPDREWYDSADCAILEGKRIGISVQSLDNAYWIGVMSALEDALQSCGAACEIASCGDNAGVQIEQVEGFISEGCDLIMVHPSDASALEEVCARAREWGIRVMCWDDPMENSDANWLLDNRALGLEIGRMAGAFIRDHYSERNKAGVLLIGHPQTRALAERARGIVEGLEETAAGEYEIVRSLSALTLAEALDAVEVAIGVHPGARVAVGTGAGPMLGADEAFSAACGGAIPEDMGVFSADATGLQLEHLRDPASPARGVVGYEGSDMDTARCCAALFAKLLRDEIDVQNIFRPLFPITEETLGALGEEMESRPVLRQTN